MYFLIAAVHPGFFSRGLTKTSLKESGTLLGWREEFIVAVMEGRARSRVSFTMVEGSRSRSQVEGSIH